jgi:protocatechuate 3,4-dioxygenase beta subunit
MSKHKTIEFLSVTSYISFSEFYLPSTTTYAPNSIANLVNANTNLTGAALIEISGLVLDNLGSPLYDASVEVWSADQYGVYQPEVPATIGEAANVFARRRDLTFECMQRIRC